VAPGTATITAASAVDPTKTASVTVEVVQAGITLTAITLNLTTLNLNRGDADGLLTVSFEPSNFPMARRGISWTNSNNNAATVIGSGPSVSIHAVAGGTTTITAASTDTPTKTASATVKVTVPLTAINLSPNPLNHDWTSGTAAGSLTPAYIPTDTTDEKAVTWESSNPLVATVNPNTGVITAQGLGSATITATSTANNSIKGTATVNVIIPVTGITLSDTSLNLTKNGADGTLTVSFTPTNTTQTDIIWTSNPSGKVEIIGSGSSVSVHAIGGGTTTITATAANGITDTCTVSVAVPLTGISLSQTSLTLNKGDHLALTVGYIPADTTDAKTVTWESSNEAVATVSNGIVHAVDGGTATITAKSTANPGITAACAVTVNVTPQVTINGSTTVTVNGSPHTTGYVTVVLSEPVPNSPGNYNNVTSTSFSPDGSGQGTWTLSFDCPNATTEYRLRITAPGISGDLLTDYITVYNNSTVITRDYSISKNVSTFSGTIGTVTVNGQAPSSIRVYVRVSNSVYYGLEVSGTNWEQTGIPWDPSDTLTIGVRATYNGSTYDKHLDTWTPGSPATGMNLGNVAITLTTISGTVRNNNVLLGSGSVLFVFGGYSTTLSVLAQQEMLGYLEITGGNFSGTVRSDVSPGYVVIGITDNSGGYNYYIAPSPVSLGTSMNLDISTMTPVTNDL
jgi:uncharacterized protein YjdB